MNKLIRTQTLKKIKPTDREHKILEKEVNNFIKLLEENSKKLNLDCDFFLGGSFGKNTYIKGNFDVDIFCRFNPKKYDDKFLSSNLKKILDRAKIKYRKEKGSRDYYKIYLIKKNLNIIFELVPIFKINKNFKAQNSTDFSPFHVEFLKEAKNKNKNLCDEIRLTKQFFKAHNLYGAESYIGGFSGHVIDNLIIYYKSLDKLIIGARNWNESFFLDVNNNYKTKELALKKIEGDKVSNLILVDPILKTRNAARAISTQKYNEFLFLVNSIKKLSRKDFMIKKLSISDEIKFVKDFAKKNNLDILIYNFDFKTENDSEDIIGSKLLKIFRKIKVYFEKRGFNIFKSDFKISFSENCGVYIYYLENIVLSKVEKVIGPKIFMRDAVKNFLKNKKEEFYIDVDRVILIRKRKITKLNQISNIKLKDLKIFLEKDLSFVKLFKKL